MRRAVLLLVALAAVTALALWLARLGGTVQIQVGETWIGVSFPVALLILAAFFLLLHTLLAVIGWARRLPGRLRERRAARRRADGDAAITRALLALAAGTGDAARLETRRARVLLGETPQTLLLSAEAARLAGREEEAAGHFQTLAGRDDGRFLGLRGLLRQAMQRQDWPAAQRLAREAESAHPGAAWLREERQALALSTRDWREALALTAKPGAALILAAAQQEADPARAAELEKQAFNADPGFAPAALAHAARLAASGSARRARTALEQAWVAAPHPDIGAAWLADFPDALARVKAVEDLTHRDRTHPEARLLMARAALDAGLTGRARSELEALAGSGRADRRAWLMLAELEEAEHGDTPDARAAQARWLREAATAAEAPRWRCTSCATDQPAWAPECPACGTPGHVAWVQPGMARAIA